MIRKMKLSDYDSFIEMANEFYNSSAVEGKIGSKQIESTFKYIVNDSPYIDGFIFEVDNEVAGFAILSFAFATECGGLIVLFEDLYVRPKFQGQGIGSKMLDYVEEKYQDEVVAIKLEVAQNNNRAMDLYHSFGYNESKYVSMMKKVER